MKEKNTIPAIWLVALISIAIVVAVILLRPYFEQKSTIIPLKTSTSTPAEATSSPSDVPNDSIPPEATSTTLTYFNGELTVNNFSVGQSIASPLHLEGSAKAWYFEAVFPVKVTDSMGHTLGSGIALAQGDWMTSEAVPYSADITFVTSASTTKGFLVLSKDNPSGDPSKDKSVKIPVVFTK